MKNSKFSFDFKIILNIKCVVTKHLLTFVCLTVWNVVLSFYGCCHPYFISYIMFVSFLTGREGTLEYKLNWFPKFCNRFIVFVGSKTLGSFSLANFSTNNFNRTIVLLVYHHWALFNLFCLLSYPLRSLFVS